MTARELRHRDLISEISANLVISKTTMSDPETVYDARDIESNKVMAILAYIWLLFLVPLLAARLPRHLPFYHLGDHQRDRHDSPLFSQRPRDNWWNRRPGPCDHRRHECLSRQSETFTTYR